MHSDDRRLIFNQKGFTLMEVMIAITVLAFITIAIVTIQDNSRSTKNRIVEEDKNWLQVETAFSRFQWDFTQIYSPLYYSHYMKVDPYAPEYEKVYTQQIIDMKNNNFMFNKISYEGLPIPKINYPEKHTIQFFTTSNRRKVRDIKQSHFAWVKYSLEKDPENENAKGDKMWVRRFKPEDPFNSEEIDWDEVKAQVLLRNVEKISFEYWSHERDKWVDNHDLIKNSDNIIHGIKIILEWIDKDGFEQTFVRVYRPNFPHFEAEDMYELKKPLQVTNPTAPQSPQ